MFRVNDPTAGLPAPRERPQEMFQIYEGDSVTSRLKTLPWPRVPRGSSQNPSTWPVEPARAVYKAQPHLSSSFPRIGPPASAFAPPPSLLCLDAQSPPSVPPLPVVPRDFLFFSSAVETQS